MDKLKKVLLIGMTGNYGGLETFMINIFRKLNGKGFKFDFINDMSCSKIAYEDEIISNGGNVYSLPISNDLIGNSPLKYVKRKSIINKFFKEHNDYDVVHLNCLSLNSIFWIKAAKKEGIKKSIIHGHIDKNLYKSKLRIFISEILAKWNRLYLRKNNNIVRLSASHKAGKYMYDKNPYTVISNGIDVEKYLFSDEDRKKIRKELKIMQNENVIITVARLDYQKNYPKIINVFEEVHNMQSHSKLVVVGDGLEKEKIKNLVHEKHLEQDVIFLGIRNDVNKLLSIADVILMPSIIEAFPFALLESQASGVPGVVSKDVIPPEENVTGELTYVSLNLSDRFWAKVVTKLLKNKFDKNKKISMNKMLSDSKYNLNNAIDEIKKLYS